MSANLLGQTAAGSRAKGVSSSRRSRCSCVCVRASHRGQHAAAVSTGRRELLLSSAAAAATAAASQLLYPQPARASVIDNDDEPSAALPSEAAVQDKAPAAAPAQPAAGSRYVVTPEGNIQLRTNDEAAASMTPTDKQIFTLNRRVQAQNRAPDDFPGFIREGFDITVVGEGYELDPTNGLIFKDFVVGNGTNPVDGQQVIFDYTGYNESGTIIDTSYRKGRAAEVRLGINGLIPGFELGIKGMKPGGKRRIVVPPALGPPVGPQTFFSAKQCEVFDVELRQVKTCSRRQLAMFSDVVCE